MASKNAPAKVLLVGWDAADWKVIHPLMEDGKMPNVQRLVENGAMALALFWIGVGSCSSDTTRPASVRRVKVPPAAAVSWAMKKLAVPEPLCDDAIGPEECLA